MAPASSGGNGWAWRRRWRTWLGRVVRRGHPTDPSGTHRPLGLRRLDKRVRPKQKGNNSIQKVFGVCCTNNKSLLQEMTPGHNMAQIRQK